MTQMYVHVSVCFLASHIENKIVILDRQGQEEVCDPPVANWKQFSSDYQLSHSLRRILIISLGM